MITQKHDSDCCVAALAMFLGREYEEIAIFCTEDEKTKSGVAMVKVFDIAKVFGIALEYARDFYQEEKALLVVDSLVLEGQRHLIYWDTELIQDPARTNHHEKIPEKIYLIAVEKKHEDIDYDSGIA